MNFMNWILLFGFCFVLEKEASHILTSVASDSLILIDARHVEEDCQTICLLLKFGQNAFIVPKLL